MIEDSTFTLGATDNLEQSFSRDHGLVLSSINSKKANTNLITNFLREITSFEAMGTLKHYLFDFKIKVSIGKIIREIE